MSEEQIRQLAAAIIEEMRDDHPPACRAFTDDEIATLRHFCQRLDAMEKTALTTLVNVIIGGSIAAFVAGVVMWIKKQL